MEEPEELVLVSVIMTISGFLWDIALLVTSIFIGWMNPFVLRANKDNDPADVAVAAALFMEHSKISTTKM